MKKANCIYKNEDCPICPRKKEVSEMTNEQILYKAVRKAVKNGWKMPYRIAIASFYSELYLPHIIFDHEFAKAFWGEEDFDAYSDEHFDKWWTNQGLDRICVPNCQEMNFDGKVWEFHLQQMVLEKEPLKYIKLFL